MSPRRKSAWAGFTMVELAVVAAVAAVLVVLLIPAVQKVRDSSNRAQCANNLRQIGIALQSYAMTNGGRLPQGGWMHNGSIGTTWCNEAIDAGPADMGSWLLALCPYVGATDIYNYFAPQLIAATYTPEYYDYTCHCQNGPCHSVWNIHADPSLAYGRGLEPPYQGPNSYGSMACLSYTLQPPKLYLCPADTSPVQDYRPCSNYFANTSTVRMGNFCGGPDFSAYEIANLLPGVPVAYWRGQRSLAEVPGPFKGMTYAQNFPPSQADADANALFIRVPSDIPDGLANTIAVGEVIPWWNREAAAWRWTSAYGNTATTQAPINYRTDCLEPGYLADPPTSSWTCSYCNSVGQSAHSYLDYQLAYGYKSQHPGGANFLFLSGSVKFVSENINHTTFQYLGCRNDGNRAAAP